MKFFKKINKVSIIVLAIAFMLGLGGIVGAWTVYTNPATVTLGTAGNFAVLAGSGITDTTPSAIVGNAGSFSTPANGLPNGEVTGTNYTSSDAAVSTAKVALKAAYDNVFARSPDSTYTPVHDLGGETLGPGIYYDSSSFAITGTLTLDGGNNPNSVFIFQAGSSLTTATNSIVSLINGAQACNVYWQVGSDATLGTTSHFSGTIMAKTSITDDTGSTVVGRLLADADNNNAGAVTLNGTNVTVPKCAPSLLLQKAIAGGGPDANTAWTLTATRAGGTTNLSGITGATGANSDLAFPAATFEAGTYTLAETGVSMTNYTPTYSCSTVNNGVTTVTTSSSITLVAGDRATCIITNTYTAPPTTGTLHVIKTLNNLNGGTLHNEDFSFSVNGGAPVAFEADGTNDLTVAAGTYSVTEPAVVGYATSYNTCTGLVIAGGGSATCTITNNDIAPKLTITKTVINLDGGVKHDTDFSFFINGVAASLGVNTTTIGLKTVSETPDSGYTPSSWGTDCTAGGTITLAIGDIKTCTITNDDIPVHHSSGGGSYTPPVPPLIDVVKIPSPLALPLGPGPVTYTYTLRNIGTVPVTSITMVDDTCSPLIFLSGDLNADKKLDVNETWTYDCFETLSVTHTNIVTATGWANGISATDIATATVVVGASIVPPLIHVTKVPSPLALTGAEWLPIHTP